MYKKAKETPAQTVLPNNCYAEKARNWLWLLGIIVVGATVYAMVTFSGQNRADPSAKLSSAPQVQVQNVASIRCPYCPGFLDVRGRCNVPECPAYSPNRPKPSRRQIFSLGQVLIEELALEVKPSSKGKDGVVIHLLYIGGHGQKAGLRAGDRIHRFHGRRVKDVEQFQSLVAQEKPGANVKIQAIRNKKRIKTTVMIGEGEMEGVTIPNN